MMKSQAIGTIFVLALTVGAAQAASSDKVWVSGTGTDSGTCQITAPCRTFAFAQSLVNAGGEIDVKDTGAYGTVTINKSLSIIAQGVIATIAVPVNGSGITIAAGANDVVTLIGLTFDGHSDFLNGAYGNNLCVKVVSGNLSIDHSIIKKCNDGVQVAYQYVGSVVVTNNTFADNLYGILSQGTSKVYISGNVIANSAYDGLNSGPFSSAGDNAISGSHHCDTCDAAITLVNKQ